LKTSHPLALAVDLPRINLKLMNRLRTMIETGRGVVPATEDRLEPLVSIYPPEASSFAQTALAGDDFSLQSFAKTLLRENLVQTFQISEGEHCAFQNVNSPTDLQHSLCGVFEHDVQKETDRMSPEGTRFKIISRKPQPGRHSSKYKFCRSVRENGKL
jgi:hypothetical protein